MDRRKFLKGACLLATEAVTNAPTEQQRHREGDIRVDPDVLAEIREKAPDESPAEAYQKLITESVTFDYDVRAKEVMSRA